MAESKSFLDTMAQSDKPESFGQEKFEYVNDKKKKKNIIIIIIIIALLLIASYTAYYFLNKVTVPDLVGMNLADATDWAQKNKITLSAKSVYNLGIAESTILSQEIQAGTSINKNSTISIQVSLGPDPEEIITFPDIESMTASEIEIWISDNKLTGAKLATANSDVVSVDKVVSYTFTDGSEDNFKRKNRVTITVSTGPAELLETVILVDFSAMKAGSVLQWGSDNGVAINLTEAFDDYVSAGNVISQSVKTGTEIKRIDGITVVISKGKPVTVPSFTPLSTDEANTWAKLNNVILTILQKYSNTVSKGKIYSQSIASGNSMKEGDEIKITVSLGKVDVVNFVGKTKLDILNWQSGVNEKGANIKLAFTEAYGDKGTAGTIISQSIKNDLINTGTTINIVISMGMKIAAPDFTGLTETECNTIGKDTGLAIAFAYQYSTIVAKGYVISQSPLKNTIITDDGDSEIKLVISLGKVDLASYIGKTKLDILNWQSGVNEKGANIKLAFTEAYGDKGTAGTIISQSIKNDLINTGTTINIVISMGMKIAAPDFTGLTETECNTIGKDTGLAIAFAYQYSNIVAKGYVISQSPLKNTIITDDGDSEIKLVISLGKVDLASYIGKTKLDILNWQSGVNEKGANIKLAFTEAYGDKGTAGTIISQSVKNELIYTGTTINILISKGIKIVTPDFTGLTEAECNTIGKDTGVKILYDYQNSSSVIKSYVISQSPAKDTVITDADTITVVISLTGLDSNSVVVCDFSSMKASAVLQWGSDNGVMINLAEAFNSYISAGNVISQSVVKNTVIKKTDIITVLISKGPLATVTYVTVPNFALMSKDEANTWARLNNITLTIYDRYSNSDDKGMLYSQSITSGSNISENSEIKLVYSLGRVDVASFIGKTKLDIMNWQKGVNVNGANIILAFAEAYGEKGTAGTIISQSVKNDFVNAGTTINVVISLGMKIATPDFAGRIEAECITIGRDAGLTILFDYQYSDSVATGYVISQSYAKDTIITDADTITIVISLGVH